MTPEDRFWRHVDKSGDCWLWTAHGTRDGYGRVRINKVATAAHRASWVFANGPIPAGMYVLHRCDVKRCVRPDHLFLGTARDNTLDMIAKGRDPWSRGVARHVSGSKLHPERMPRGEAHPLTTLTEAEVRAIRVRYAAGGVSQQHLADEYGVTQSVVSHLTLRKTWAHVD